MGLFDVFSKNKDEFPFSDSKTVATITCVHVLNCERPILHVSHDYDDGCWQFLCGVEHSDDEARVVALEEIYNLDNTIKDIANLDYGHTADRVDKNSKWIIK